MTLYMYRQRPEGEIPTGAAFSFLGGKPLKDIKTRERHDGAELPRTLRHAPKEMAKKGLLAAREKGKEQLLQAAQNGMGGAEQTAPEESTGDRLLGRTEAWGRDAAAGGRDMLRRIPARVDVGRRAHRLEKQGGTQPADRTARWRALSRRKARGSPTHSRAGHTASRRAGPL